MKSYENLYPIWYNLTSKIEDGIILFDNNEFIQHVNDGMYHLFPIENEKILGKTLHEFIVKLVFPFINKNINSNEHDFKSLSEFLTGKELIICSGPGKGHTVEFSILTEKCENTVWKMAYFRKITRLKNTQAQLINTEERYKTIFQNLFDSVAMYPVDELFHPGSFVEVNNPYAKRLGYSSKELLELSPVDIIPPDQLGKYLSFLKNVKINPVQTAEFFEVTHERKIIPVEITVVHINIEQNNFIIQISRDISDRASVRQLQKNAFDQINKNLEQFAILNDKIRNPLSVILTLASYTDSLENSRIMEQIQIIDKLVDDLDKGFIESEKVRKFLVKYFKND